MKISLTLAFILVQLYGFSFQRDVLTIVRIDEYHSCYLNYSSEPPNIQGTFSSTGAALDHLTINKNSICQNVYVVLLKRMKNLMLGVHAGIEREFINRINYEEVYEQYALVAGLRIEKKSN